HQEAAGKEVSSQDFRFLIVEDDVARAAYENPRAMEQLRVSDLEYLRLRIDLERGKLLQPVGEVQVGVGKIGPPRIAGPFPTCRTVFDAREGKSLPGKFLVNRPQRHIAPIDGPGSVVRATPSSKLGKSSGQHANQAGNRDGSPDGGLHRSRNIACFSPAVVSLRASFMVLRWPNPTEL